MSSSAPTQLIKTSNIKLVGYFQLLQSIPRLTIREDFVNRNRDFNDTSSLNLQNKFAVAWKQIDKRSKVMVAPTIEEAIDCTRKFEDNEGRIKIFVTGGLHLVGGVLSFLEGDAALAN